MNSPPINVKPEPQENHIFHDTKQPLSTGSLNNNFFNVKNEPGHSNMNLDDALKMGPDTHVDSLQDTPPPPAPRPPFSVFESAEEIDYIPESALKEGMGMVRSIKNALKKLELGSKLRKEVWAREIDGLLNQGTPKTLIAVCGATGAGKSSVLNAVLDDNVVPTSGMRACTAVVTEISYHKKSTIDADIAFLSELEWRQELDVLLHDLVDEDGNIKRLNDLKSDAGIAWQKVHAVYPTIDQERLIRMTPDQILQSDRNIMQILGTTKTISSVDSKAFGKEIAKYIDSKEKRVKKDKKEKEKEKKAPSLMDTVRRHNNGGGSSAAPSKPNDLDTPALWPLIRQVKVRCRAEALSTGAILVDLPGVADANAARGNIAKDYMKKCNCIWILAPIQRAVDDKTAKDLLGDAFRTQLKNGNYDDHTITFIASKNDDISCSEVIPVLGLDDDPELEEIEDRILEHGHQSAKSKKERVAAEKEVKQINAELDEVRAQMRDHEAHIEALQDGVAFEPSIKKKKKPEAKSKSKKRKNTRGGKKSPKRRRSLANSSDVDDDDDFIDDATDESDAESDADAPSDSDDDSSKKSDDEGSDSDKESDEDDEPEIEEITEEILKEKIKACKENIKTIRKRLDVARTEKKRAADELAVAEKQMAKAQREKNAFCALKRSEYARSALKNDFREGLKELDDAAAEERDPDNFNPTHNLRDYDAINLPVFTVSSRDYVRLKGQVKGDGAAACFSNIEDTSIPDLQKWCKTLTVASRDRAARIFLTQLKAFATSIRSYVQGIGDVTAIDRESLREKWESQPYMAPQEDPYAAFFRGLHQEEVELKPKLDRSGKLAGIAPRLCSVFEDLVTKCVQELQQSFKDSLEDKCRDGAVHAATAAIPLLDEFQSSMHWATYRATLRRHGSWRRDLNVELITPFTKNIASTWSKIFESNLFGVFESETIDSINQLVKEVEESAASGLKDRARLQGELSVEEARLALKNAVAAVKEAMNVQQKEVSRCLSPHIQRQLVEGYDEAMTYRGTGSVARQKTYFRGYISEMKDTMFDDGADTVMERLTEAAEAVGATLSESMGKLAEKVEVSLAVLWEGARDDPQQLMARKEVVHLVNIIREQIALWTTADNLKQSAARSTVQDVDAMQVDV